MNRPRTVNRTVLTAADQKAFQRVQRNRSLLTLLPFSLILLAGGGIWLIFSPEEPFLPVFFMALGLALPFLFLLSFAAAAARLNRGYGGQTLTYAFFEEGFSFSLDGGENFLSWDRLRRAEERSTAFYLYVDRRSAAIVKKEGFAPGGEEETRALLTSALGKRFRPGHKDGLSPESKM